MSKIYLKKYRLDKGFTIQHLSDLSGVSKGYISDIENNKNINPSVWVCYALCRALDISIYQLMEKKITKIEAWVFQHEETGMIDIVDDWQVQNGFEKNNPRWQKIKPIYDFNGVC